MVSTDPAHSLAHSLGNCLASEEPPPPPPPPPPFPPTCCPSSHRNPSARDATLCSCRWTYPSCSQIPARFLQDLLAPVIPHGFEAWNCLLLTRLWHHPCNTEVPNESDCTGRIPQQAARGCSALALALKQNQALDLLLAYAMEAVWNACMDYESATSQHH